MSQTIKNQIIEQVDRLDDSRQQQVLDFARRLTPPAGTPGRDLLQFAGCIDLADLEAISRAVEEGCEKVDHPCLVKSSSTPTS